MMICARFIFLVSVSAVTYICFSHIVSLFVSFVFFFFLNTRPPPRSTPLFSSAASDVYKRQGNKAHMGTLPGLLAQLAPVAWALPPPPVGADSYTLA